MQCSDDTGMHAWGQMGLQFIALIRQGVGNKGGHLIHELVRDAAVQQACEAAHVAWPCSFTLCFDLHHQHQHCRRSVSAALHDSSE